MKKAANCNCGKNELYKVYDPVWAESGLQVDNPLACISCLEESLDRKLKLGDLDRHFPWWKAERDVYYHGITDGIDGKNNSPDNSDGQYEAGLRVGSRFRENT